MKNTICTRCMLSTHAKRHISYRASAGKANIMFIVGYPNVSDEAIGKILSKKEIDLLELMLSEVAHIQASIPLSYIVVPMVLCRPTDSARGETREPDANEILACSWNVTHTYRRLKPKRIFLCGKLVERFYKKEIPESHTIQSFDFLLKQGGDNSPWYKTNLRIMMDALK